VKIAIERLRGQRSQTFNDSIKIFFTLSWTPMKNQNGLSMSRFLFAICIIIASVVGALKCAPPWIENAAINRGIKKIKTSGETNPATIRSMFQATITVDNITSLTAHDLTITKSDGGKGVDISYDYESRIPLFSNVSVVFSFSQN
jgi:hypothetical protein